MTAPKLARNRRSGRRYEWPPKSQNPELVVPSITTCIGMMDKPALRPWTAKAVATFAVDNILGWEKLPRDEAIDLLKRAPYRDTQKAADKGTAVHAAIESWQGGEPEVDPDLLPYVAGAIQFLDDHVAKVLYQEVSVFSRQFQYAGTMDVIAELTDGRIAVIDWKTSRSGLWPEVALQLAAGANAEFIGTDDGKELDLPDIDCGIAVHLTGTDPAYSAQEIDESVWQQAWFTFRACRQLRRWKDDHEADALGPKITPQEATKETA